MQNKRHPQKRLNKTDRVKYRFCEEKRDFAQNRSGPSRKQDKKSYS